MTEIKPFHCFSESCIGSYRGQIYKMARGVTFNDLLFWSAEGEGGGLKK